MTLLAADECRLFCPTEGQIDLVWPVAGPLIQRALDRGSNYTLEQIHDGLKSSDMQLWMWSDQAAMVTTIQNRDDLRWCLILTIAGENMPDWIEYLPIVEDWARQNGCDEMRLYGRIGWSKITGYDVEWTKMSKRLQT